MALYKYPYKGKYKNIIQDWGDKEYCEQIEKQIDDWLKQFEEEDKCIAIRLLEKFKMYRQKLLSEKIKELYGKFCEQFTWANQIKTVFMLADLKNRLSNSTQFACEFQKVTNLNINDDILRIEDKDVETLNNKLVFIDDYSGSGESFIESLDLIIETNNKFRNFEYIFLVINISETALFNIKVYSRDNNLDVKIISVETSLKAFQENYIFNTNEYKLFKEKYLDICKYLEITSRPFGYRNSEALIAFDVCVPNNNLSLFREKSELYNPLIYRRPPQGDELYEHNKKKTQEYYLQHKFKATRPIFNFRLFLFIVYCTTFGQRLNISKTCKTFGLTMSQYAERIELCRKNNLLTIKDERYVLGRNFDETFSETFSSIREFRELKKIVKKIISGEFVITEEEFCDIIKYTPVDFEKRFQGYK